MDTPDSNQPTHSYRTVAYWHTQEEEWTLTTIDEYHPTLTEAEHSGQRWGCLAGIRRVEVYSPDGSLQALWDKEAIHATLTPWHYDEDTGEVFWDRSYLRSKWQRVGVESQALGRRNFDEVTAELRAAGKLR